MVGERGSEIPYGMKYLEELMANLQGQHLLDMPMEELIRTKLVYDYLKTKEKESKDANGEV